MKLKVPVYIKSLFSHGWAASELVARSLRDSAVYGIEQIEEGEKRLYDASFGDIREVASTTGKGFNLNGTMFLRSREDSFKNMAVFGASGSGKSSVVAACNLLNLAGPSIIVHDPSGQLVNISGDYLTKNNYEVMVIDFNDPDHSAGVNLFDFIHTPADANKLAAHLSRTNLETQAGDKFWELSSTSMIRMLISLLKRMDQQFHNMANLRHILQMLAAKSEILDKLMAKYATNDLFLEYMALMKGNQKTLSSVVMSAQAALQLWNDENICRLTSKTTIDFDAFRKRRCALFLKNATFDATYYRPLISIILENILKIFMSRLPEPDTRAVWMLIDETDTLRIKSLDHILSNNRKYAIGCILFFQSKFQAYAALGEKAGSNLLANCYTKLFLTGSDRETANELEELLGKRIVRDEEGREQIAPLMLAQNIRQLKASEALLICGAHKPFRIPMTPFYKSPFLNMRVGKEPFVYNPPVISSNVPLIPLS